MPLNDRHDLVVERLKQIAQKALAGHARPVTVNIALGELNPSTLGEIHEAWTLLAGEARLVIHLVRAELQCMACFHKYHPQQQDPSCPQCGAVGARVLSGEEFHLISVEEDHE